MKCPAEATSWRQQGDWGWLGLEDEGNGCGQSSVSVWVDESIPELDSGEDCTTL